MNNYLKCFLFSAFIFAISKINAQHLIGVSLGNSEMFKKGDLGESINYAEFEGFNINIMYQFVYKRVGLEMNLFNSSLKVNPYFENYPPVSHHLSIENFQVNNIETKGISFNGLIFIIPKAFFVKIGYHILTTSYINGTFFIKETQNITSSPVTNYYNITISSGECRGNGLTFGPGFVFKIYKHLYINGGIDFYFTSFNQNATVKNKGIFSSNQDIKYSYLNWAFGLSYSLNK